MKTKEKMLKVIYDKIADNTLSFGCRVSFWTYWMWMQPANYYYWVITTEKYNKDKTKTIYIVSEKWFQEWNRGWKTIQKPEEWEIYYNEDNELSWLWIYENVKIIWHPVMIWDVLGWFKENHNMKEETNIDYYNEIISDLLITWLWSETRKSIDKQSIECIEYIYNLIKQ